MVKISIVMLTTAFFAGLIIADPYGSRPMLATYQTAARATAPTGGSADAGEMSAVQATGLTDKPAAPKGTKVAAMAGSEPERATSAIAPLHASQPRSEKRERFAQSRVRHHS